MLRHTFDFFTGGPKIRISVAHACEGLAEELSCENLHIIHRLDKETTGVMLLAKYAAKHSAKTFQSWCTV